MDVSHHTLESSMVTDSRSGKDLGITVRPLHEDTETKKVKDLPKALRYWQRSWLEGRTLSLTQSWAPFPGLARHPVFTRNLDLSKSDSSSNF